jgi:uncharacterized protein YndB with AHSA1/START domain
MNSGAATFDVVVQRVFEAPVERVWRAWSDPAEVQRWWGPTGFTCPMAEVDFREGGRTLVCMRAPREYGGGDMFSTWNYTRIVPHERIEYVFNFSDPSGARLDPADLGMPAGVPADGTHIVVSRTLAGGRTEMTMTEHGYTTTQARDISKAGLEECLDKMAVSVEAP